MELTPNRYHYLRGKSYAIAFMQTSPSKESGLDLLKDLVPQKLCCDAPHDSFFSGLEDYVLELEARAAKAVDQVQALYPTTLDLMNLENYEILIANHNKAKLKSWGKAGLKPILVTFTVLGLIVLALSNFQLI